MRKLSEILDDYPWYRKTPFSIMEFMILNIFCMAIFLVIFCLVFFGIPFLVITVANLFLNIN